MRTRLILLPLLLAASPANAQAPEQIVVPPELTSPATAEKLSGMMQALSKAFLNMPVGEIEAAVEGRAATPADKSRTIRDVGRLDNPNFERDLDRQLADSRVAMQAGMKAFAAALPAMMKGLGEAAREMDKAMANLPSPNYPKR